MTSLTQPTRGSARDTECPICHLLFTQRGLRRHITCSHPRTDLHLDLATDLILPLNDTVNPLTSFVTEILQAKKRIAILRIIPRSVRSLVAAALARTLTDVIESRSIGSWKKLLSFALSVLRLPPGARGRREKLHKIIKENLKEFERGISLTEIIRRYPIRQNFSSRNSMRHSLRLSSQKLSEGDVRAAVRHLCSTDTVAGIDDDVIRELLEKHPPAPSDLQFPPVPHEPSDEDIITVSNDEVLAAIKSFPKASSGGFDGLRPRHLRDALGSGQGLNTPLVVALARFCELMANGKVPDFVLKIFYGAGLTPLRKETGGLRPIACGLTDVWVPK